MKIAQELTSFYSVEDEEKTLIHCLGILLLDIFDVFELEPSIISLNKIFFTICLF